MQNRVMMTRTTIVSLSLLIVNYSMKIAKQIGAKNSFKSFGANFKFCIIYLYIKDS